MNHLGALTVLLEKIDSRSFEPFKSKAFPSQYYWRGLLSANLFEPFAKMQTDVCSSSALWSRRMESLTSSGPELPGFASHN